MAHTMLSWNHGGDLFFLSSTSPKTAETVRYYTQKSWWSCCFTVLHAPYNKEKSIHRWSKIMVETCFHHRPPPLKAIKDISNATSTVNQGRWTQAFYGFHHDFIDFWWPRIYILGEVEVPTLQVPPWKAAISLSLSKTFQAGTVHAETNLPASAQPSAHPFSPSTTTSAAPFALHFLWIRGVPPN